ncbi:hypothetical protein K3495_g10871 [Podosphaera aphanis]|nr:hypothetical protein K3495_g10871 [Podosphaera aphanis]
MSTSQKVERDDPKTNGDVEKEGPTAQSAEDRKAAAALSSIDTHDDDPGHTRDVDHEAVRQAMNKLSGDSSRSSHGGDASRGHEKQATKNIKLDAASVALIVVELELSKTKAMDLLRAHDGQLQAALRAYVHPSAASDVVAC